MRLLLAIVSLLPLCAQAPPPPPAAPSPAAQPPAASAPAADKPAETPSPVPAAEQWLTGSVDVGYRWQAGVGGSFDTYRSFVNLGSGPKLLGADFTIVDPKSRLFDHVHIRASDWGDDPYSTLHVLVKKMKLYELKVDYRNIAYFDYLPSYADPLLARGIVLNEQSFDTRRKYGSFLLDLLPGNWFTPYLGFDLDSGSGTGATTFVTDGNEFPVPNTLRDRTNLYRGGVHFELPRFHATLEEGGTTFKNDQSVYTAAGSPDNFGNSSTPLFGQQLYLGSLLASYGIRGNSTYSKGLFTTNAISWMDLYGQFLYSQPDSTINYQQSDRGNLLLQSQVLFYNTEQFLLTAAAKLPHTSASAGAEIHRFHRVRITESWLTDRLHNSGSAASNQMLQNATVSLQMSALLASSLVTNYNQNEINVFYDATSRLTVRGGYRYVWGDANDAILPVAGLASSDQGKLRRNVGIGGFTFHPAKKISLLGEVEAASSGGAYFRTSLYNYQKARAQARYQATASLSFSADFNLLDNQNPVPGVNYDYRARQESLSFLWAPKDGKIWDFQGSYSRSAVYSNIGYLEPETLTSQQSLYRENAHTATGLFSFNLPNYAGLTPKITAGGSFFISSGSLPSSYYQPVAKVLLPVRKNLTWFAEWKYYGYGEVFDLYEGFRTHLLTTGLRLTR